MEMSASIAINTTGKRCATRLIFFIAGLIMGLWAALIPYVQQRTSVDAGELGLLLLCLGAGSLVSMSAAGRVIGQSGCRLVIIVSTVIYCLMLPLLASLTTPLLLALVLFIFGIGVGLCDVAMNVQGSLVEQASGQPLMSGFHFFWSLGGIVGAASCALLFSLGVTPLHTTLLAVLVIVVAIAISLPALLPFGNQDESDAALVREKARPNLRLVLMAIMAMVCFMAEGAAIDWSGIFITQERGLAVENAGWGFAVFALTMSLMRFLGDRVVRALGRTTVLVCGGLIGCLGYLIAVIFPGWIMPLCGFALVGVGTANIVPVLITLAGQEKVMPVNMSVAMVATLGYLGILGGPAILGWISQIASLSIAFLVVALAFLVVVAGALKLKA